MSRRLKAQTMRRPWEARVVGRSRHFSICRADGRTDGWSVGHISGIHSHKIWTESDCLSGQGRDACVRTYAYAAGISYSDQKENTSPTWSEY